MPRVPKIDQQVQTGRLSTGRFNVSASEEAFGGGADRVGKEISSTTKAAVTIADKIKKDTDDLNVNAADLELSKLLTQKQLEAEKHKGKDAAGAYEPISESWKKEYEKIESGLASDTQKKMLRERYLKKSANLDKTLQVHISRERLAWDNETTQENLKAQVNDAVLNYKDSERVQEQLQDQSDTIDIFAKRNGKDALWVKNKKQEQSSLTHKAILNRMLDNDEDKSAKEYFKSAKKQMTAVDAAKMEGIIAESTLKGETQRHASVIMERHGEDLSEALEEARKIKDPDVQEATVKEVKIRVKEQQSDRKIESINAYKDAFDIAAEDKSMDRIPREVLADMTPKQRMSIESYVNKKRAGKDITTDKTTFFDLESLATNKNIKKSDFLEKVYQKRHDLSEADFKYFTKLGNKDKESEETIKGIQTNKQIVDGALLRAEIDPNPKSLENKKRIAEYRSAVDDEIKRIKKETGKFPTSDQIEHISDTLLFKGVTEKGFFSDTEKRLFEVTPEDKQFIFDYEDIPADKRRAIERSLKKHNFAGTKEEVKKVYAAELNTMDRTRQNNGL